MELVRARIIHRANAGVDEHLEAVDARGVRDVDVGVADRGAIASRLRNRIDLGVNGAIAVLLNFSIGRARFVNEASCFGAMRQSCGRAVVAGRENAAVADDDGADLCAQAGRALGDLARNRHEVLVPARTMRRGLRSRFVSWSLGQEFSLDGSIERFRF